MNKRTFVRPTITEVQIALINELIANNPTWGRTRLSKELCLIWNWCDHNGNPKDISCRDMLRKLNAKKQICLPNIQKQGRQPGTRDIIKLQIHDTTEITCSIKIGHLASHILGRVCRRISTDWQEKYGHPIYLLETFVEQNRFKGTCYKAANWINVGETTGRSRNDRHTSLRLKMPQ